MGVDGVYARTALYEDVVERLAALITRHREPDTEVLRFPPVMSRAQLEKSGYLKSFPNLLGCVCCLHGTEREIRAAVEPLRGRRRLDHVAVAGRPRAVAGRLLPGLSDRGGPRPGAGERPAFRRRCRLLPPRAFAVISTGCSRSGCANMSASAARTEVSAFRERWMERAQGIAGELGLTCTIDFASDPFFGRVGQMKAVSQKQQALKFELLVPVRSERKPTACMSFNYHRDHFGVTWDIRRRRLARRRTPAASPSAWIGSRSPCSIPTATDVNRVAGRGEGSARLPTVTTGRGRRHSRNSDATSEIPRAARDQRPKGPAAMRSETIAVHGGYDVDPTTKAVAVPIYQTASYAFDSADHGAALFNLEVDGFRYTRIGNPTNAVLERRVAALEGGIAALSVACGQAATNYAVVNIAEMGTQHRLGPAALRHHPYAVRAHPAETRASRSGSRQDDQPASIEKLIDDDTRAVFCESVGNPAGNVCDIEAMARGRAQARRAADRRQHGSHADPAAADRVRRGYRGAFADEVHGRARHDARRNHRRQRQVPVGGASPALSHDERAGAILSRAGLHRALRGRRLYCALPRGLAKDHWCQCWRR